MNKIVRSCIRIFTIIAMLVFLMPTAVNAEDFKISADKISYAVGDTVTLTASGMTSGSESKIMWYKTDAEGTISGQSFDSAKTTVTVTESTAGTYYYKAAIDTLTSNVLTVTVTAPSPTVTSVTVSSKSDYVVKGSTLQFTAVVDGTNSPAQTVTWDIEGERVDGTSISSDGTLTVSSHETATSITVRATSTVDTGKSGTATVTVKEPAPTVLSVRVGPDSVAMSAGTTQQFKVVVTGTNDPAQTVAWKLTGYKKDAVSALSSGTSISEGGLLKVAADETCNVIIVTAASTVDASKSGFATVTVPVPDPTVNSVTVSSDKGATSVTQGVYLQFTATVTGTNNPSQEVTWSIDSIHATGTSISSTGLLTVAEDETADTITVRAASTVDTGKSGTFTVSLPKVASTTDEHYHYSSTTTRPYSDSDITPIQQGVTPTIDEGAAASDLSVEFKEARSEVTAVEISSDNILFGTQKVSIGNQTDAAAVWSLNVENMRVTVGGISTGSTILTLYKSYLDTLAPGTYTVRVYYGESVHEELTFIVIPSGSPDTGDRTPSSAGWGIVFLASIGIAVMCIRRKHQMN